MSFSVQNDWREEGGNVEQKDNELYLIGEGAKISLQSEVSGVATISIKFGLRSGPMTLAISVGDKNVFKRAIQEGAPIPANAPLQTLNLKTTAASRRIIVELLSGSRGTAVVAMDYHVQS